MDKPSTPKQKPTAEQELPAIEFVAQGSFSIHNPEIEKPSQVWRAAEFQLGEHRQLIHIDGVDAVRSHTLAMLEQAQHSVCIYSYDLEAWLYSHSCIQQTCKKLLIAHPKIPYAYLYRILHPSPARAMPYSPYASALAVAAVFVKSI